MTTETQAIATAPATPFFAYDPENGVEWFETMQEAQAYAAESLREYRRSASFDGEWSGDVEAVKVGHVTHFVAEHGDEASGYDYRMVSAIPAPEGGPRSQFTVDDWDGGRIAIQDADFTFDAALEVTGDFEDRADKREYAERLCAILNTALAAHPVEKTGAVVELAGVETGQVKAPAEGDGMLETLVYAAMMHNGKPKTVAEFERAAANVADMLQRRAEVTHNKPVASIYNQPQPKGTAEDDHDDALTIAYMAGAHDARRATQATAPADEVEELKAQNRAVAQLIIDNDKAGAVKWAQGLFTSLDDMEVRAQAPAVGADEAAIRAAALEEAAKVCDDTQDCGPDNGCCPTYWNEAAERCAANIRARASRPPVQGSQS